MNAQPGTVGVVRDAGGAQQPRRAARPRREDHHPLDHEERAGADASPSIVHAEIPGDGSTTQEVAISGHLYEGVIKQGANDDNSGCALTLEIGRAYIKLINEGKLPRPKRTINFQWVPEISGHQRVPRTRNPEKKKRRSSATLNFDMEGIRVSQSRSYWVLQRTPDTFPSYLNDIAQSMMEYVADISRERVRFRALSGYAPTQPVESPRGSKDAFYIKIDKHYGSSDHVDLHAARHSGRDVHHVAGHVVPLVGRHARQAGSDAVQARRRRRHRRAWRCSRPAPTRWRRAC